MNRPRPPWVRPTPLPQLAMPGLLLVAVACGSTNAPDEAVSPPSGRSSLDPPPPTVAAPLTDQPPLSVLTFNINFGIGHDPANVEVVEQIDADLVLLQETTTHSEAVFREALTARYPHILFRDCCNAGGLGILSKYPIVEEQYLEPNVGWFPAWRVVVDTPGGRLAALNVHLRPPMSDRGSWVGGYFSTRKVRAEEIADLWTAMGGDLPTLVAGDFNENAGGLAIEFLAEQGLRSALPQLHPRAKTWHWRTKVGQLHAMLDHVVYSDHFELHDARVLEEGRSDHYPVVVVLGRKR